MVPLQPEIPPGLNDGASAILIVSEDALNKYNLKPKARIVSNAIVGVKPSHHGHRPVEATRKVLQKDRPHT
jgi:acetyl-CoA C-acetyltransferase